MKTDLVILKPAFTEKSLKLASSGRYTFIVDKKANKNQIRKALKEQLGVEASEIKTLNVKGEVKRIGKRRTKVSKKDFKKAIVTLRVGQKIDIYEFEEKKK